MPCCDNNNSVILKTLRSIDQRQKEAILSSECITCENSLRQTTYNTIPVALYLCNGEPFRAYLDSDIDDDDRTPLFRIEEVICDETVKLRLIQHVEDRQESNVCTRQTVICNIGCICCLQCFPPITCETCHANTHQQ